MPKLILALLLTLLQVTPVVAALPNMAVDPNTRESLEYMDGKLEYLTTRVTAISGAIPSTSTVLGVAYGGTGATTPAAARVNLGAVDQSGAGAYGTWPISITGTAGTATLAPNYLPLAGGTLTGPVGSTSNMSVQTSSMTLLCLNGTCYSVLPSARSGLWEITNGNLNPVEEIATDSYWELVAGNITPLE